ncbi:hypothetical protein FEM49_03384 (plasmid) [Lactiplantibacillus plantarum]|nr:hypothetical protein FEM49_03384 [Lactiplantibacillus plantarum]
MQQVVLPIKDSNVLKEVQDTLLNNFKAGRRNYTVFQVGKATLLRVSDVMRLKQTDIFNPDGSIKQNAFIHDRKTGKPNTLYLGQLLKDPHPKSNCSLRVVGPV